MNLRFVRIQLPGGGFECLVTNLSREEFSPSELGEIYGLRWGIETSFRTLKYTIGLTNFHSKKRELVAQEVFARLILYNFTEMITIAAVITQKDKLYTYKVNFTVAVHVCRQFLRCLGHKPPEVLVLIAKNTLPVKTNRNFKRPIKTKSAVSFLYRVA